jgi:hypothetical protein
VVFTGVVQSEACTHTRLASVAKVCVYAAMCKPNKHSAVWSLTAIYALCVWRCVWCRYLAAAVCRVWCVPSTGGCPAGAEGPQQLPALNCRHTGQAEGHARPGGHSDRYNTQNGRSQGALPFGARFSLTGLHGLLSKSRTRPRALTRSYTDSRSIMTRAALATTRDDRAIMT